MSDKLRERNVLTWLERDLIMLVRDYEKATKHLVSLEEEMGAKREAILLVKEMITGPSMCGVIEKETERQCGLVSGHEGSHRDWLGR